MDAPMCTRGDLLSVHSRYYLSTLTSSCRIMTILEVPGLCLLPSSILQWRVLIPMMYQTGGTIQAVVCAMEYGWAINLGGGFHHASAKSGGGFCVFADISIAIQFYYDRFNQNGRVLIIDLDAHQGVFLYKSF